LQSGEIKELNYDTGIVSVFHKQHDGQYCCIEILQLLGIITGIFIFLSSTPNSIVNVLLG